jgi:hypothetical protein
MPMIVRHEVPDPRACAISEYLAWQSTWTTIDLFGTKAKKLALDMELRRV